MATNDARPISNLLTTFLNLMKTVLKLGHLLGLHHHHQPISAVIDDGVLRPRITAVPPLLTAARAGDLQCLDGYVSAQLLVYDSDIGIGALNTVHFDFYLSYLDRCQTPLPVAALFNIVDCEFVDVAAKTRLFRIVLDRVGQYDAAEMVRRVARRPGLGDVLALVADRHQQLGDALEFAARRYADDGQRGGYEVVRARIEVGDDAIPFRAKTMPDVLDALSYWSSTYRMVPDNLHRRCVYYADYLKAWADPKDQHDPARGIWRHYWALWAWSNREIGSGSETVKDLLDNNHHQHNRDFIREVMEVVLSTQLAAGTPDSEFLDRNAAGFPISNSKIR